MKLEDLALLASSFLPQYSHHKFFSYAPANMLFNLPIHPVGRAPEVRRVRAPYSTSPTAAEYSGRETCSLISASPRGTAMRTGKLNVFSASSSSPRSCDPP